eukprot:4808083-Alexandrium_andersonii.AAC.1
MQSQSEAMEVGQVGQVARLGRAKLGERLRASMAGNAKRSCVGACRDSHARKASCHCQRRLSHG